MQLSVYKQIRSLIEETNNAYTISSACEHVNGDFALFASLSLAEFKSILANPDLTPCELQGMLRRGARKHQKTAPKSNWASFVAQHVAGTANSNVKN